MHHWIANPDDPKPKSPSNLKMYHESKQCDKCSLENIKTFREP
jgi:hypothetical protein